MYEAAIKQYFTKIDAKKVTHETDLVDGLVNGSFYTSSQ